MMRSVSYTHLDVYKRQILKDELDRHYYLKTSDVLTDETTAGSVAYTHLDVYKRQDEQRNPRYRVCDT